MGNHISCFTMTATHSLRDSLSNWLDSASTFCMDDVLPQSNTGYQAQTLDDIFAKRKSSEQYDDILGVKRNYPYEVLKQTVNPADVFSAIRGFTQPEEHPHEDSVHFAKRQRLNESTASVSFLDDFDFREDEHQAQPLPQESTIVDLADIDSLLGFPSSVEDIEANIQSVHPPIPECTYPPQLPMHAPADGPVQITAELSFGKRGNGNQPWQTSCVAPPKIGKMRKISVQLTSSSPYPMAVKLRARTCDQDPHKHKGKLVLCSDDRCCVKTKVEGQRKPVIKCPQRLSELVMPEVVLNPDEPTTINVFLKPEWNGLGANKTRPRFDVYLELIDCQSGEAHELLAWDTELQSHKFESSHKAKCMETSANSTFATTLTL